MGRRKIVKRVFPLQFWAVVYNNTIVGPFTDIDEARTWASHRYCTQIMSLHVPMLDEPNKGHDIGRFLLPNEM